MGVPTRQDSGGLWIDWMVVSRGECYASTGPVSKSAAEDYARDQLREAGGGTLVVYDALGEHKEHIEPEAPDG